MTDTTFSYSTDIRATPEAVWRGLTERECTRRFWRHPAAGGKTFPSEWTEGSTYDLVHEDIGLVVSDPEQVVLASDPFRRLSYTWHTFTPEWARAVGLDDAAAARWRAEPRSRVCFEIDERGAGVVRLTVVHEGFEPGSEVREAISQGWPAVVSSLKTLLETGEALP